MTLFVLVIVFGILLAIPFTRTLMLGLCAVILTLMYGLFALAISVLSMLVSVAVPIAIVIIAIWVVYLMCH